MQGRTQCSILMLKESSSNPNVTDQEQQEDKYEVALQNAFADDAVNLDLTYMAPLTILPREPSLLSESIAAGSPPLSLDRQEKDDSPRAEVWAFAVTSQNAVRSFVRALDRQPDLAIREEWLRIPIYSLTGATFASVQKAGFKNINNPAPAPSVVDGGDSTGQTDQALLTSPSFNNAEQLVDFLLTFEWPQNTTRKNSPPYLWFLTGETRMKTLAEKLKAHNRPFQEVVVYETGPRSGFEQELSQWLSRYDKPDLTDAATKSTDAITTGLRRLIWLVGFSPRGVELTMPVLGDYLTQSILDETMVDPRRSKARLQWAAIGQTTSTRIKELLAAMEGRQGVQGKIESVVAVAKAPNPLALAESIRSYSCSEFFQR